LAPVTIAYQTFGTLNKEKSNAILICHALSGDSNVVEWWGKMVGEGKPIDTKKYFVICSNVIGGCYGSTGPATVQPFPSITISDMVNAQKKLIDHLGISRLLSVIGGSMGGMQGLQWSVAYPQMVKSVIPIATTTKLSAQGIAFNEVGRHAIMLNPKDGLAVARMIGHITYLSDEAMHKKFGRRQKEGGVEFEVESYLKHQGSSFTKRFDANSYVSITKAIDRFDLAENYNGLAEAFAGSKEIKFMVVSFTSDWLFPAYQSWEIVKALKTNSINVSYRNIGSTAGHDAFLLDDPQLKTIIGGFLSNV